MMPMYVIEDLDDAGEGLFIVEAETKCRAIALWKEHVGNTPDMWVTSVERTQCVSLALVTGERGESYYTKRSPKCHPLKPEESSDAD